MRWHRQRPRAYVEGLPDKCTQGKCVTCRVRLVWSGAPLLREARCPRCFNFLQRTSVESRLSVVHVQPRHMDEVSPWSPS